MKRLLIAAAFLCATPAAAQMKCNSADHVRKILTEQHGESIAFTMNTEAGPAELWVNPETETFSLVLRPQPHVRCMIGDGTSFTAHGVEKPAELETGT